ncbi:ribokinase [Adhaeribacter arboris]|uniref:Ribokinase n=1 Tax=Adhaeribacter arboris TaxID=2072846 RepID=A0A2T2YND9_9BACT|nr:ribokinase [Adhaeribacter arboris]PSR57032.1 ribokinase [Adhaeribacter arboris]
METKKITVIGSTNMDMVVKTTHLPVPGETVLGGSFFMNPGGKGANQAVAVARLGGDATFVTKIGMDVFGKQSAQLFDEEGINTSCILSDHTSPSGVALIMVDQMGENSIAVASGANANLMPEDVERCLRKIGAIDIILLQLEIPLETVDFVTQYAAGKNIKVIVNPAPANLLSPELLKRIDIITPNSKEVEMLSGVEVKGMEDAKKAATVLYEKGVKNVIVTLGPVGALVLTEEGFTMVPAQKVNTVDTTAAGDVFNGALAVALAEEQEIIPAVEFACLAAALSVTKLGAQSSIPYRNELIAKKMSFI